MYRNITILLTFSFAFCILITNCTRTEDILGEEEIARVFLIVKQNEPDKIKLLEFPSLKIIDDDYFYSVNNYRISESTQIAEFREFIFLFQSGSHKIIIVESKSFRAIKEIDWSSQKRYPSSIAFPNATSAFISFSNDTNIAVLDLTNLGIAREISLNYQTEKLNSALNYVVALHFKENKMSIIDTRTYSVVKVLDVSDRPFDVEIHPENNSIYVLSLGKGKIDTLEPKTEAKISIFRFPNFDLETIFPINLGNISAINIVPTGLVVSNKFFGFISTNLGLLRFSLNSPYNLQRFIAGSFTNLSYNYKGDEIISVENKGASTVIFLIDGQRATVKGKYTLNFILKLIFPK
ncbi:MAG: hypothetical protein N2517_08860 [Ignavibacteria bacterium]|nr:hypothetical protein [Ignavibacteria bacterium]